MAIATILLIGALICAIAATLGWPPLPINLLALAFALFIASILVGSRTL